MSESDVDTELVRQQAATLYTLYQHKARSMRRSLIGLAALMTIVFCLIFWPYTMFRGDEYALARRLAFLESDLAGLANAEADFEEQLGYFEAQHPVFDEALDEQRNILIHSQREHRTTLDSVRARIGNEPGARAWLDGEADRPDLPAAVTASLPELPADEACFWLRGDAWLRCRLPRSLRGIRSIIEDAYGYTRISHLRNELSAPLRSDLHETVDAFEAWLLGERSTWREGQEIERPDLVEEFNQLTQTVHRTVVEYLGGLGGQHFQMTREAADLESRITEIQGALDHTRSRIAEISALQDIDTPFGPLPIGVNDLVMLFPVLLAAGFYLTMVLGAEVLELRQSYFHVARRGAPDFFTKRYVAMIAPVWVDPLRPTTQRLRHCALLALPALLFVASIGLLIVNGLLWGDFMDEVRLGPWSYYAAYMVSALLFAAGAWRFASQYRSARLGDETVSPQ